MSETRRARGSRRCTAAILFALAAFFSSLAQVPRVTPPRPLEASLDVPLDSRRMQKDAPVFASAIDDWKGANCKIEAGATITGHVVDVASKDKGQPEASLTLLFDKADCSGKRNASLPLMLYAIIDPLSDAGCVQEYTAETFGSAGSQAVIPRVDSANNEAMARSSVFAYSLNSGTRTSLPSELKPGQVIGIHNLSLSAGTGPGGASSLHSAKQDFRLSCKTRLILVPVTPRSAPQVSLANALPPALHVPVEARAAPPPQPPSPPPPPDLTEICAAKTCSEASSAATVPPGAMRTVSIGHLGYRPRKLQRIAAFDAETTVSYLSAHQLLVTFDAHHLRSRSGASWPPLVRHTIRALLLNTQTGAVQRVLEWQVDGTGRYLWPDGPERVLVHMNGVLQAFGPDLKSEAALPAAGDLLWVATSPSGHRIAYALLRERHTQEVHEQIARLSDRSPAEDVEIRVADRSGRVLQTVASTSGTPPPVLTEDGGELVLQSRSQGQWSISEQTGNASRTIAAVHSDCAPRLSMTSAEALFVVGCSASGEWYRMLRKDGRTLIKGQASPAQLEQSAVGSANGTYAVRVIELGQTTVLGAMYEDSNLHEERVAVHRGADGRQILLARTDSFPRSADSFALSPDGRQLALLTGNDIALYEVMNEGGAKTAARR